LVVPYVSDMNTRASVCVFFPPAPGGGRSAGLRERQPGRAVGGIDHYFFASAGDERERAAYEQQNGQKKSQ